MTKNSRKKYYKCSEMYTCGNWIFDPPQQQNFRKDPGKVAIHTKSKVISLSPLSVFVFGPVCTASTSLTCFGTSSQLGLVQFYQATHQPSHANILANPFWTCQDWRNIEMPARRSLNSFEEETAELIYHGSL